MAAWPAVRQEAYFHACARRAKVTRQRRQRTHAAGQKRSLVETRRTTAWLLPVEIVRWTTSQVGASPKCTFTGTAERVSVARHQVGPHAVEKCGTPLPSATARPVPINAPFGQLREAIRSAHWPGRSGTRRPSRWHPGRLWARSPPRCRWVEAGDAAVVLCDRRDESSQRGMDYVVALRAPLRHV